MKPRKKTPVALGHPQPKPAAPRPPLSTGRKWLFRLVALALPLLVLALLEIGLRIGGYGYDPAFFKQQRDATGKNF